MHIPPQLILIACTNSSQVNPGILLIISISIYNMQSIELIFANVKWHYDNIYNTM